MTPSEARGYIKYYSAQGIPVAPEFARGLYKAGQLPLPESLKEFKSSPVIANLLKLAGERVDKEMIKDFRA